MKIIQQSTNRPTERILTPSPDFYLKLKGRELYFKSAVLTEGYTIEDAADDFDEVSALAVPKSIGKLREQQELLEAAGVKTTVPDETPGGNTPPWKPGEVVKAGEVRKLGEDFYRCAQPHKTQADWSPPAVPALWVKVEKPAADGTPAPWKQPTGAHDAYAKGNCVTFNGAVYESLIDGNAYSPTAYPAGWKKI